MNPKFVIRCATCRWARMTTGIADDLKDMHEIARSCVNCGSPRKFKCPKCGRHAKMIRVQGNK